MNNETVNDDVKLVRDLRRQWRWLMMMLPLIIVDDNDSVAIITVGGTPAFADPTDRSPVELFDFIMIIVVQRGE